MMCLAFSSSAAVQAFALPSMPSIQPAPPSNDALGFKSNSLVVPPSNSTSLLRRLKSKLHLSATTRGARYGNSTILTPSDAAIAVGVKPTLEASKSMWQTAWKLHRFLLPIVHFRAWDKCRMKDSKLALAVLWWKAM
jgi:hypothetical protein